MTIWTSVLWEEGMTKEEFAEAYQEHRGKLLSHITRHGDVDEDTADEILHRAMFGRPIRTNGISAGMYGKRQDIPKADFLRYAYGCVKIEIREWYREYKRILSDQDLAFQDKEGACIPFDPSTHQVLEPVEHAKRPTCPPNRVACPVCDHVLSPQPTYMRGTECSCGLAIARGIEPRYTQPQGKVIEPQNWNIDEDDMVARLDFQPWGDSVNKAMAQLSAELEELVRRVVVERQTLEAIAEDWQQSPDVVKAGLDLALRRLHEGLVWHKPRVKIRLPISCPCSYFDQSFPSQDLIRCYVCGEVRPGRREPRREFDGTMWQLDRLIIKSQRTRYGIGLINGKRPPVRQWVGFRVKESILR